MRLPFAVIRRVRRWAHAYIQRRDPDLIVGSVRGAYMRRWHVLKSRLGGIYVHQFVNSDDPRALHDHPWPSVSIVLDGYYGEILCERPALMLWRHMGDVVFRGPRRRHRIVLDGPSGRLYPVLTLFIFGPRVREWGFWCPQGFVPWRQFVSKSNPGEIGAGCGSEGN